MNVTFSPKAWEDYQYWFKTDPKVFKKLGRLIEECRRSPYEGTGKPEPLRHNLAGKWSRRITEEHRLIYEVGEKAIIVIRCRFHYREQ